MAVYDGFFDAVKDDDTGEYDRAYEAGDFTGYFANIIGSGVCVHGNEDSFKVRLENGKAVVSPGYLFIQGYWLKNDADYPIDLPGTGNYAIVAKLNLGQRMIGLEAQSVVQSYPDSLVLAIVSPTAAEDTRYNTDICGIIDAAGELSTKVEWALNYIDTEIESKLQQVEQDIAAQELKLDAKIAEVQAVADSIIPPPVGSIKFSASQNVGDEWLKCDGSFISETQYPELVVALGKLIPSGDKFSLISSGEIGPQISNGVIYGGRMWVYSYSTKKLYGVDLAGTAAVKEIAVTSNDPSFNGFIAPTPQKPIALSIVPSAVGGSTKIFLCQVLESGSESGDAAMGLQIIFEASFSAEINTLTMESAITSISIDGTHRTNSSNSIPYVASIVEDGVEKWICAVGLMPEFQHTFVSYLEWGNTKIAESKTYGGGGYVNSYYGAMQLSQRIGFSRRSNGEAVFFAIHQNTSSGAFNGVSIVSAPKGLYSRSNYSTTRETQAAGITVPGPMNIVGANKLLFEFSLADMPSISTTELSLWKSSKTNLSLPSAARTFIDAAAYLWGKDIYMIFVGTGIIFSRTLEDGSFGYLDTTSVLGTITQFGYLDYSQDEGTLYLLGQDTTNTVKVAKIVLNTLYDYANDGAWLPMIASDGVPAYIKAKETEGPSSTLKVTISYSGYSHISGYVVVTVNGEIMSSGTYTYDYPQGTGEITVGVKTLQTTITQSISLKVNGTPMISLPVGTAADTTKTLTLNVANYMTGGMALALG